MAFQVRDLLFGELKHKILGKTFLISFDLTIHLTHTYLIHCSQVTIKNDRCASYR